MGRVRKRTVLAALLGLLLWCGAAHAQTTTVVYFYEASCMHCTRIGDILTDLETSLDGLTVERHDIHTQDGRQLLWRLLAAYELPLGPVPMVFVGDLAMIGSTFYGLQPQPVELSGLAEEWTLRGEVESALAGGAPSPRMRLPETVTELVLFVRGDDPASQALETWAMNLVLTYPLLAIRRLDLDDPAHEQTFSRLQRMHDAPGDPPAVFVGNTAMVGGRLYIGRQRPQPFALTAEDFTLLEAQVTRAVEDEASSPLERLRLREQLTLWAVIGAALLDSLNPCDFALMLLLMGTLIVLGKRMSVLWAGLAFIAGTYVTYFLMGFGVYSLLGMTVGSRAFRIPFLYTVSSFAIVIGLWQMKDLLWYGRWFSIEVPDRWKPRAKKLAESVASIPGAFVIGALESLFLAPCTSGPYLAILTLLSQTTERTEGVLLLLLYNFVFVIPLIVLAVTVHFGFTTTARAERWRSAKAGNLHFITGLVMFTLGVGMIIATRVGLL